MKILIAIPKYNLSKDIDYSYNFPLGLSYISSTLKSKGYEVDCINLNHYCGIVEELINKALNKKKYDVVCSGGNALIFPVLEKITKTVHIHKTHPLVILGGPIITSEPKTMFELLSPDFAVMGEGEVTIIELLRGIDKKRDPSKINGIVYKDDKNKIVITDRREPIKDIESIPLPDFEGVEFEKQLRNMHCNDSWTNQVFDYPRTYPLFGSRGCPFNCTFCWHDMKYRARSVDNLIEEIIIAIKKYNINNITIYDDCFSAKKERLYEFCKKIKKLSIEFSKDIKWNCQLLVNTVDEDMLKTMKDAGCNNISYGFESFSPTVLKSMKKPITPQRIDKALNETLDANIGIQGNFIFGDIAETKETARETLKYWNKNNRTRQISLGFIQPYPGSYIFNHCLERGIIKDKINYIKNVMSPDNRINMTEKMSDEEIHKLSMEILRLFRKYFKFVTPKNLKVLSKKDKTYEFDFNCPYCKKTIHYKNCFLENKFTYGFHIICRNCHMRSVLVGPIKKIAYKHYTKTRAIRNYYVYIKKQLMKRRV